MVIYGYFLVVLTITFCEMTLHVTKMQQATTDPVISLTLYPK